jgi:hypothetical protein
MRKLGIDARKCSSGMSSDRDLIGEHSNVSGCGSVERKNSNIRLIPRCIQQARGQYATAEDFRKLFAEDMTSLYLLAFLLTGGHEKAEQCFVSGIEDCAQGSSVFQQWARTWARRVIVQNAVRMIAPRPCLRDKLNDESPLVTSSNEQMQDLDSAWAGVLALENFDRFVFVVSLLEGHADPECAALLGCTVLEVGQGRIRALQRISDFSNTSIQPVDELTRTVVS